MITVVNSMLTMTVQVRIKNNFYTNFISNRSIALFLFCYFLNIQYPYTLDYESHSLSHSHSLSLSLSLSIFLSIFISFFFSLSLSLSLSLSKGLTFPPSYCVSLNDFILFFTKYDFVNQIIYIHLFQIC